MKVFDWTYEDLIEYANRRACDGNWSLELALTIAQFIKDANAESKKVWILKQKRFKNDYWNKNKGLVFNFDKYPNLEIDIVTGNVTRNGKVNHDADEILKDKVSNAYISRDEELEDEVELTYDEVISDDK